MSRKYAAMWAVIATATLSITPVSAKDPSPKKLMEMAAGCAYVVGIAEGNKVKLNYGLTDWINLMRQLEQATGLDSEKALDLAVAKYDKRARVMGADEAFKHMLARSKDCDREMGVFMA